MQHYKGFPKEIDAWLNEVALNEAPWIYTRWLALGIVAAMTERKVYMPYMTGRVYPNMYIIMVGDPASKKSTVIASGIQMLRGAGYKAFCPVDLTKASLLNTMRELKHIREDKSPDELADDLFSSDDSDEQLLESLFDDTSLDEMLEDSATRVTPLTAINHEMQTLLPKDAGQILSVLQDLWDSPDIYPTRMGSIRKPYVNMICGLNTETLPVVLEQKKLLNGLMSRLVFVHGAVTGRTCDGFEVAKNLKNAGQLDCYPDMVKLLQHVRTMSGPMTITEEAREFYTAVSVGISKSDAAADARFNLYAARREVHLLKMAMAHAITRMSMEVVLDDLKYCHTLLCYTESYMPEALGEYGYVKAGQGYKAILDALGESPKGLDMQQIQKKVSFYLTDMTALSEALHNLHAAGLIDDAGTLGGAEESQARTVWTRKPSDLQKWQKHFGTLVFPELLPEWGLRI